MSTREEQLNDILERVVRELDIPPHKYRLAMERFETIKSHLEDGEYPAATPPPSVYLQGSFRYGTVVRPLRDGKDAGFDLDMVCEVNRSKEADEAKALKEDVGVEVKSYAKSNGIESPKDKRRCWTLKYKPDSDGYEFHVDILPGLPDREMGAGISRENHQQGATTTEYTQTTIAITNREDNTSPTLNWRSSNPNGYAKWFKDITMPGQRYINAQRQKEALFEAYSMREGFSYERADEIPDALLRTPLQRAIQIMKRHRDVRFNGHPNEKQKPISMVISTLAARLYEGQVDMLLTTEATLRHIVELLAVHANLAREKANERKLSEEVAVFHLIERVNDTWYIPNPVNPHYPGDPVDKGENFADRWHENGHAMAKAFFQWVIWLQQDLRKILQSCGIDEMEDLLTKSFGDSVSKRVVNLVRKGSGITTTIPTILTPKKTTQPSTPDITTPSQPSRPWGN